MGEWWSEAGLVILGASVAGVIQVLNVLLENRRSVRIRASQIEEQRVERSREHAARAIDILVGLREQIRRAEIQDSLMFEVDDSDYVNLQRELALISDSTLRLAAREVASLIFYPLTMAAGPFSQGYPYETQGDAVSLLWEALSAYARGEYSPKSHVELLDLAKVSIEADKDAAEQHEENLKWAERREAERQADS